MIAHRFLLPGFLLLILAATPAWAQTPPVANAPVPGADFLRADGGDPVPDTTAPWRYFPLHIGNAWEYLDTEGRTERRYVEKDTLIEGRRYFILNGQKFSAEGEPGSIVIRTPLRFDTLAAQILRPSASGDVPLYFHCPLDLPFGVEATCEGETITTGGGYDVFLVFPRSDGDPDSVRTAVKSMADEFYEVRFGADFGEVYYYCSECGSGYGLQAVRLGGWEGEVYGELQYPPYPVASEDAVPEAKVLSLSAFPNSFRSRLTVVVNGTTDGVAEVELIDMLGRTVHRETMWAERTLRLSGEGLTPGVYLVRIRTAAGDTVTKKVLKL